MNGVIRKITRSEDAVAIMAGVFSGLDRRECWAMFLRGNSVICSESITVGTIIELSFDTRRIVRRCIETGATGVLVVQNHVSGDCTPGSDELESTTKIHECLKMFDIAFVDHIIIGEGKYFTFAENMCKAYDCKVASA